MKMSKCSAPRSSTCGHRAGCGVKSIGGQITVIGGQITVIGGQITVIGGQNTVKGYVRLDFDDGMLGSGG